MQSKIALLSYFLLSLHIYIYISEIVSFAYEVNDRIGGGGTWQYEVLIVLKTYGEYDSFFYYLGKYNFPLITTNKNEKNKLIYLERNWKVNFKGQY